MVNGRSQLELDRPGFTLKASTRGFRKTHSLLSLVPVPSPAWEIPYAAMAREDQLAWATLDNVTRAAGREEKKAA
jgi:hypothetical protein